MTLVKIFLILLSFNSVGSCHAAALEAVWSYLHKAQQQRGPGVAQHFLRAISQGEEQLQPVSPASINAFLLKHYMGGWVTKPTTQIIYAEHENWIQPYPCFDQTLVIPRERPLVSLHNHFYEKYKERKLESHTILSYEDYNIRDKFSFVDGLTKQWKSFVPGNEVFIHGKTTFPIVGISIFAEEGAKRGRTKKVQSWLTPIEKALLISSHPEYMKRLAILKEWATPYSYDRFALGFIPPHSDIIGSIGIAGPQPSLSALFAKKPSAPVDFKTIDYQEGGAIQFYLRSVSNMHWVDIDVLDGDKLNVAEGLHKLGLITEEERKTLVDFRGHWSQLV